MNTEKKYTEKELVEFGEYLLSDDRNRSVTSTVIDFHLDWKLRQRVFDADIANFNQLNQTK